MILGIFICITAIIIIGMIFCTRPIMDRLDMGHSVMDIIYGKDHHKRNITKSFVKERKNLTEALNTAVENSKNDTSCKVIEGLLETNKELILKYDKEIFNEGKESTRATKHSS